MLKMIKIAIGSIVSILVAVDVYLRLTDGIAAYNHNPVIPSYTDFLSISLTAVTVVLAVLAIIIAIVAIWGYTEIKEAAVSLADKEVKKQAEKRLSDEMLNQKIMEAFVKLNYGEDVDAEYVAKFGETFISKEEEKND